MSKNAALPVWHFFRYKKRKDFVMRVYLLFFLTYTLMQILFAGFYLMMVHRVDMTLVMGIAIYVFGMYRGYQGYQYFRYKEKRKKLIDDLLA